METAQRFRQVYRRILRELPLRQQGTKLSSPSPLQRQIREHLLATPAEENAATHLARLEQYVQYAKAQRVYITLLERYNPGMNMSEEDRVRLTARRVGMDLPVEVKQ